jgi:hypothetical protein
LINNINNSINTFNLFDLLSFFIVDKKADLKILPDYIFTQLYKDIRERFNDDIVVKINFQNGILTSDINKLREIWKFKAINDIPYIGDINYKKNIIEEISIKFNKMYRLEEKSFDYFNLEQLSQFYKTSHNNHIYLYSFSKDPNNLKPTGSCNFSYINNFELNLKTNKILDSKYKLCIFNRYYNILDVDSGMANLIFFK